jgi:NAD(P)-dependent dehydrogenase (short-subunit alcohol dehydrogenase family)
MLTVCQELSKSLQSETGKLYGVKCDVTKNSDIEMAFKWVKDNLGGVDILVNNAGVPLRCPLIGKCTRAVSCVNGLVFSGAFAKLRKATVSFVMYVCPSAWHNLAPTGRIFMKFNMYFRKCGLKMQVSLKSDNNNRYFS